MAGTTIAPVVAALERRAPTITSRRMQMGNDRSDRLVEPFVQEVPAKRRSEAIEEQVAPDLHSRTWGPDGTDRDGLRQAMARMARALSDVAFTIDDTITDGDRVAGRLTASATQTGELMGMPPTGRRSTVGEIHMFRIADDRIMEHWHQYDQPGMTRQLQG
jgi:predicted ester cyclase